MFNSHSAAYLFALCMALVLFYWVCVEAAKRYATFVPLARRWAAWYQKRNQIRDARALILAFSFLALVTHPQRDALLEEFSAKKTS